MALKLSCVTECFHKTLSKRNLTTVPLIPIPEYGQSNATILSYQALILSRRIR